MPKAFLTEILNRTHNAQITISIKKKNNTFVRGVVLLKCSHTTHTYSDELITNTDAYIRTTHTHKHVRADAHSGRHEATDNNTWLPRCGGLWNDPTGRKFSVVLIVLFMFVRTDLNTTQNQLIKRSATGARGEYSNTVVNTVDS